MGADELGAALRRNRQAKGLSQNTLAERARVSRNFVAQIERGESTPTVATLARLAAATVAVAMPVRPDDVGPTTSLTFPCGQPPPRRASIAAAPEVRRRRARSRSTQR